MMSHAACGALRGCGKDGSGGPSHACPRAGHSALPCLAPRASRPAHRHLLAAFGISYWHVQPSDRAALDAPQAWPYRKVTALTWRGLTGDS